MTEQFHFSPSLIFFGKSVVIESTPRSLKWTSWRKGLMDGSGGEKWKQRFRLTAKVSNK